MEKLNKSKTAIKANVTKLEKFMEEITKSKKFTSSELEVKLKKVNSLQTKVDELRGDYYDLSSLKDTKELDLELEDIEERIENLEVKFTEFLSSFKVCADATTSTSTLSNAIAKPKVKLPEIPLPEFSGKYDEWLTFKVQFNSLITNNDQLDESQRLYYLRASLKGDAKQLQTFDDSFQSLLKALNDRYENQRLLVDSHIQEILEFEKIQHGSAKELRYLIDCVNKNVRALKELGYDRSNLSDAVFVNVILKKVDKDTRKEFESLLKTTEVPKFDSLVSFLENRSAILESIVRSHHEKTNKMSNPPYKSKALMVNATSKICVLCKGSHALYSCPSFLKMNPGERYNFAKKYKLCINCLGEFHQVSSCKSKYSCNICHSKHNYLLHRDSSISAKSQPGAGNNTTLDESGSNSPINKERFESVSDVSNKSSQPQFLSSCFAAKKRNIVLATALMNVKNGRGGTLKARALLDCGSQICAMSSDFAQMLGVKKEKTNSIVSGLADKRISIKKEACAEISNFDESFRKTVEFLVLHKVTDLMPATTLDIAEVDIPPNVTLADPHFFEPAKIDILIGAEIFFDILKDDIIRTRSLTYTETVFGYIAGGAISGSQEAKHCGFVSQLDNLEENVKQFWEMEEMIDSPTNKEEEQMCEEHFCRTYRRDANGKFIVDLPTKEMVELGDSMPLAKKRLEGLWKRLNNNPEMAELYGDFMKEYEELGHMRELREFSENVNYYIMPHHGVFRAESSTTKLRVVFDASAPSSTGVSLNNCLLKGGTVQEDLFSILLRFRKHKIAFVADIKKMYRQIWINPQQCHLQCILWKKGLNDEPKMFELLTVTYGTACAPFLATRVLKQLSIDEKERYPLASAASLTDFYVDDILTGAEDIETALKLQRQLLEMLTGGGMELHKWCTNERQLLAQVPISNQEYNFGENDKETVKTLGLRWNPKEEVFSFKVSGGSDPPTKRSVLSEIARLFDPLGFLGPVVTQAKMFLKGLWQLKLDWHDELPTEEKEKWKRFRNSLTELESIKIHRYVLSSSVTVIELHGFSDASKYAYGAVVYLRCITSSGDIKVSLLCSKSRVAPAKEITIPRLELCGAVLLAKLVAKVNDALKINFEGQAFLWTDSSIVLAWMVKPVSQLKLFVKNRVSVIQDLTEPESWRHVSSKNNPADLISRGVGAEKIKDCDLWWCGPSFLHQTTDWKSFGKTVPVDDAELYLKELNEPSNSVCSFLKTPEPLEIMKNCSSFFKLQRTIAWCLRFVRNARQPDHRKTGGLSSNELSDALTCIVKKVQEESFLEEIQCLRKGKNLPCSSKLLNLCPFLDSQGVLRVGGRLKHSHLKLDQRHPMLIPNNHAITSLLIIHFHVFFLHIGAEGTLSVIRTKFWILRGRNVVRRVVRNCITCLKVSAKGSNQMMADLMRERITPSRVFSRVGIDFAGPFTVKTYAGRSKILNKCYVCVFICFSVKAVHLELVHGLTTEAFLGALKRFVARRNRPLEIYSDNGTNFVGANNELRKILRDLFKGEEKEKIENHMAREGIKWNFNPPAAPHFGGLWEAGVKSLKYHLKRIVGNSILSHEEFLTLVTQVESILNSRPLCPLSNDPNDISVLTPAHFLVGSSLTSIPDYDYTEVPMNRLSRWQLTQKLSQIFWKKWSTEYLNRLQQRPKWFKGEVKFKEGDVVLVKNSENVGFLNWHIARIEKVHPGKDNIVRVVTIRDKNGVYQRPVSRIAALPFVN